MADDVVKIYAPGSEVLIDGKVTGRIIAVEIGTYNAIKYECVWYDENGRHDEWLQAWEILPDSDSVRKLRVEPIL